MMDAMPPKLTHTEIVSALRATSYMSEKCQAQLESLRENDQTVLLEIDLEGIVSGRDRGGNLNRDVAEDNLEQAIDWLGALALRLDAILDYCERCEVKDDTVAPVYPDLIWLCDACRERA
jgi:hypothetical protein